MKSMITLTREEYAKLLDAKREPSLKGKSILLAGKKKGFSDKAFGIFKGSFGKKSSLSHVAKLRASWRG